MAAFTIGTLTLILLTALRPHTSELAASDFKTLYGSTWCFAHGLDAYSEPGIEAVFRANQTVLPRSWFGHAPVYPPFTLALLMPLAALPMVAASQVWLMFSALLLIAAAVSLMRYGAEEFALPLWGRALIAVLFSVSPLTVGALALGNVSIAASAFSILAFTCRWRSAWACGALLAVALLLKPHLVVWIVLGLLLLGEPAGRRIVLRAAALAASFCVVVAAWLALAGTLVLQAHSFLGILAVESAGGASMNASSMQPLPVIVQITALSSLAGFWTRNQTAYTAIGWTLALLAAVAIYRSTRILGERGKLLAVGSCCALGMVATYHRALDGVLLLMLLPWAINRLRWWQAWLALALYCGTAWGPHEGTLAAWVSGAPAHSLRSFVLLRQAAVAASLLLMVLLSALARERRESQVTARTLCDVSK
jgi:hypothetical protein